MGIFKNITKTLKQAAPFIGSAIGMYFGGPMGAALGSGIGSLVGGRDTEEALTAAALGGGTYLMHMAKDFHQMHHLQQQMLDFLVGQSYGFIYSYFYKNSFFL